MPWLFLTATCTNTMYDSILKIMGILPDQVSRVLSLPDRPNIFLDFKSRSTSDMEAEFSWLVKDIQKHQEKTPKVIIYCSSHKIQCAVYEHLVNTLGANAYLGPDREDYNSHIVGMFHSGMMEEMEKKILTSFPKSDCNLRVLIATIAFGLGVNIPDIRTVIHWGVSRSPLSYWQEVGRCSRDGEKGLACLYPIHMTKRLCDKDIIDICKRQMEKAPPCLRIDFLSYFKIPGMDLSSLNRLAERKACTLKCVICECDFCQCCSVCKIACPCN